ncbi:MAG: 3-oxoacyl-ACP reductase FabG [Clostridia bacterium]|nr:3-oxoacyl-ACP reductase FabG [Clostridia bacterium]
MSKTVVITGASKGIGAATAILFARKGYNVVLNYCDSLQSVKLLSSSLTGQGLSVFTVKADVANKLETDFLINESINKFGAVDILINNAGISISGLINDMDLHDSDRIFDVNLKGVYNCCKSVVPAMISQKSGKIINISSMWGQVGASCEVAYSAAKAGVIGLTKALAKELAPSGVTVNAIAPGLIDTTMNSEYSIEEIEDFVSKIPISRMGTPDEIALATYFLASDDADYITGQVLGVNGGYVM